MLKMTVKKAENGEELEGDFMIMDGCVWQVDFGRMASEEHYQSGEAWKIDYPVIINIEQNA